MTQKINPVPKGYRTVTSGLVVRGVEQAVEFYENVFEAKAGPRSHEAEGERVSQVELKIGGSLILMAEEMPEWGLLSPLALGGTPVGQKVFLAEPDAVFERALEAGAHALLPMTRIEISERSDERMGRFIDPFGHVWTVAARVPAAPREAAPEPEATRHEAEEMSAATPQPPIHHGDDHLHQTGYGQA